MTVSDRDDAIPAVFASVVSEWARGFAASVGIRIDEVDAARLRASLQVFAEEASA